MLVLYPLEPGDEMTIPDYQTIMLPLLKFLADKKEHSITECVSHVSKTFGLSAEETSRLLPSGNQTYIKNRTSWARTYMSKAGLVEVAKRGFIRITDDGQALLLKNLDKITNKVLSKYPSFQEFKKRSNLNASTTNNDNHSDENALEEITPEETIENAFLQIKNNLATEILEKIKNAQPDFLERIVVDLLLKMGYGGSRKDAGQAIGATGDEGVDGVISEDKLGLDNVYIQAKRWTNPVGRPEIQKFVGALTGQRSKKGIFITTSTFTKDAHEFANRIETKIVLIDGVALAHFLIDYNIGVSNVSTYEIKKVDSDYFPEE